MGPTGRHPRPTGATAPPTIPVRGNNGNNSVCVVMLCPRRVILCFCVVFRVMTHCVLRHADTFMADTDNTSVETSGFNYNVCVVLML